MKKLEKWLKYIFIRLFRIFAPQLPEKNASPDPDNFKRILIFRLDTRLGNTILILSLVQAIRKRLPLAQIDVMMASTYLGIYKNHPDISALIPYDQARLLKNPFRFIGLIRQLKKTGYDIVFSSSNPDGISVSQAIFSRIISKGRSVGFDWKDSAEIYSDVVKGNTSIHYADAQVDLWRYFDPGAKFVPPRVYFYQVPQNHTAQGLLIWLGATGNKVLSEEMINQVKTICEQGKYDYTLAAGPHDREKINLYSAPLREKIQIMDRTLEGISEYFLRFKAVCMPDTGPMHLAAALGVPLIQVFVHSNHVQYAYAGENKLLFVDRIDTEKFRQFVARFMIS